MVNLGRFILGLLTGALLGGSLALILTPAKGTEIRERLGNSFTNVRNEVKQATQDRMTELNQQLARMQNKPLE